MKRVTHSFLDGFATARQVDAPTRDELLRWLDPHQEASPALTPWRRGCRAGLRAALAR